MGTIGGSNRTPRVIASLFGLAAIAAFAVVGAFQILVWNPLAAVPGASLDEIHEGLARANESMTWAFLGTALGAVVVLLSAVGSLRRLRTVVLLDLLILGLGAPSYSLVSFHAGMALADAFFISGGDYAPWGGVLYTVSAAALLAGLIVVVTNGRSGAAPATA
ncbi:hypothetical protein [Paenarthrobacter nicotinovorans]|uniref:hypothetical protein n=1 Tax=Paenarthrobacter nicotinovorans TaxID=29320 RepID=UPI00248546CC|nr:hypothetical protein [Paenarthrobacter nicotinovorans]MDI2023116.1 hypothetical protein [Paenarthrobacter nicotinovorans]